MEDTESAMAPKPQGTAWMVTFADLVSLMLTFFVMLFAMSSVKYESWQQLTHSLSTRFNPNAEKMQSRPSQRLTVVAIDKPKAIDLNYLTTLLTEKFVGDPLLARAVIRRLDDRMMISLPSDLLFAPASVALTADAESALRTVGDALRFVANRVEVNGHTDPNPIKTAAFPSNWELSAGRAVSVANAIRRSGYSKDVPALGFADSRYFDLPSSLPVARRHEIARRVDLIIREGKANGAGDEP